METSTELSDLAAALAKAQGELEGAAKDKTNPAFRSKYADLGAVWEAWQEVGPKNGLSVVQFPGAMTDGKATLTSMLLHSSGQWLRDTLTIPVTKQDAQGFGSALTYARRYALSAIVGVCPVDDDGNGAVGTAQTRGSTPARTQTVSVKADTRAQNGAADGVDLKAHWTEWAREQSNMFAGMQRVDLAEWQASNREKCSVCEKHAPKAKARLDELMNDRLHALVAIDSDERVRAPLPITAAG